MNTPADRPANRELRDPELLDSAATARDLLRLIATRWRFRVQAGRLGQHPLKETRDLVERLEMASRLLDEATGSPSPEPEHPARVNEERFRLLVDSVQDYAILMLDPEGHVASWNEGAERIKGYRAEEILGRHFSSFYPPEDISAGKPVAELAAAIRDGRHTEEGWRVRKDGARFWAHATLTALRHSDGHLAGFASVTRDISALRQASEALRQTEERMRLMVEAVRDYAIFMLTPDGLVASWNVGAQRLKGYQVEEIIGKHFSIFYTQEERDRGHPADELRRAKAEGRYEEEGWRIRKDGSRFWANVVITALFDTEGRHIGFTKVTRDFTEAHKLRDAQAAVQLRDEFLSIAGHELRTPLSALLMQIESLLRQVRPDDSAPRLRERLVRASTSGQRLSRLITQLLDVSRITSGRLTLEPEPLRLDELVKEVTGQFADVIEKSKTPVSLTLQEVAGVWDPLRMEQLTTNLLGNALKYGVGKPVEVQLSTEAGRAVLRVTDHGIGIAPADQQRIFARFERGTGAEGFGGFGLGLWISRQIVEASGGTISVESELGGGATFTVSLPV